MKTIKTIFAVTALALCFSTTAMAKQNTTVAATAPAGYEEVIITAQRVTSTQAVKMGAIDRSALIASVKTQTHHTTQQSVERLAAMDIEEVVVTARRVTTAPSLSFGTVDDSVLAASIKSEIQNATQQFFAYAVKTALQSLKTETRQASL